ncbi:hypothetical protein OROMI_015648 [Orobanche minor]
MLPLSLLKTAQGHPMLVELKNGETYNGHLVNCDTWMNIHLREVICTSKDGDRFWRMPECYIRGNTIKYLRVPDEVIDKVQEETKSRSEIESHLEWGVEEEEVERMFRKLKSLVAAWKTEAAAVHLGAEAGPDLEGGLLEVEVQAEVGAAESSDEILHYTLEFFEKWSYNILFEDH